MPDFSPPNVAVAITATFTADPILPALEFVLHEAGLNLVVRLSPYNQVFQELLSPTSLLGMNASGVNVILIRAEDFVREVEDAEEAVTIIKRTAVELAETLSRYVQHVKVPVLLAVMPPSPGVSAALLPEINEATAQILLHARALPGITLLSSEELELSSPEESYDSIGDELAHMPFTEAHYASIGLAIARKVHALLVPAHKVLLLDCDETLWRGVVGEDGVEGISITEGHTCLQQFAVKIQEQGVLLCLVSKNTEQDVLKVFAKRTEMTLKLEHLVAHRINWEPKPRNIVSLAKALNLGLESFVFIDDSPVECAFMRAELPQVVTLQLPPDDEIESFLAHLWTFDKVAVTQEDTRRTSMYRENAARQELEEVTTNIDEFIASLRVVTEIAPPESEEYARVAQLTQRTNQFNFTTARRTEPEIRAMSGNGSTVLRVKVHDRFGDYGIVGLVIGDEGSRILRVDSLLLSCRVLGRGVEHAIVRHLGAIASQRGLQYIDLQYIPTLSNEPARAFAECVAGEFRIEDEQNRIIYRIPAESACAIVHQAGQDPIAVIEARKSGEKKQPASVLRPSNHDHSERYARLARSLISGRKVLDEARTRVVRPDTLPGRPEMPATETEQIILALWQELLGVDGLGVEDDYFALGGTSMIAARLFAEISRRFSVRLPLTTILEAPTVRALSHHVEQRAVPTHSAAIPADRRKAFQTSRTQVRHEGLIELRRGGQRKLFLVHDGEGETLLYLNLARRMPHDLAIFAIEPRRMPRIPLAHATIEDMAAFYIEAIRKKQAHGPYLLGGLCAGGVIAYEMASQLVGAGESVGLVALLEAAMPKARERPGRITEHRVSRVKQAIADAKESQSAPLKRLVVVIGAISQKMLNTLLWKISEISSHLSTRVRFFLLRQLLKRELEWPKMIPELSVREIYDSAQARYDPKPLSIASVLLVRAQSGEGSDLPYRNIYAGETFGWNTVAPPIRVVDVDGGHSTMLEERFVDSLAKALMPYVQQKAGPIRERSLKAV